MGEDAYIDEDLKESIEKIQELFDVATFTEASKLYDKLARNSTLGEIIEEEGNSQGGSETSSEEDLKKKYRRRKEEFLKKKM
jgi:hypothetical protein